MFEILAQINIKFSELYWRNKKRLRFFWSTIFCSRFLTCYAAFGITPLLYQRSAAAGAEFCHKIEELWREGKGMW